MADFVAPDWNQPLPLDELYASIPSDSQVKGLFFKSALREAEEKSGQAPGRDRYGALSNYPTRELVEVLVQCARTAFPDRPERDALRQLGHSVFTRMRDTAAGAFLFSVAGRDVTSAFKLTSRAYNLFSTAARAEVSQPAPGQVLIEVRNSWTLPDVYHYGIFEGALRWYQAPAEILVRRHRLCDVDLQVLLQH